MEEVQVKLDPKRTPKEEADWHFHQYRRLLRGVEQARHREAELAREVAQAQAALESAQAAQQALRLDRGRLEVRAPRAGRVDALPFKLGDQPPQGATLASLLVGDAPYARVYVPESRRVALREGQRFTLQVQGSGPVRHATLRSIAREPAFTPYYALTGDDASRLVYRAELVLTDADAASLPAGVPVQARLAR
jgi:HlyD family secretion protein